MREQEWPDEGYVPGRVSPLCMYADWQRVDMRQFVGLTLMQASVLGEFGRLETGHIKLVRTTVATYKLYSVLCRLAMS